MHTEVEMTAEISKAEYLKLKKSLSQSLRKTARQELFMVRFHRELKVHGRDPLDIRYKWRNGETKLVIKKGVIGSKSRQELNIALQGGELGGFIQLFTLLGYKTGNAMYREIERYENEDVEMALVKAGPYYFVEVEALDSRSHKKAVEVVRKYFRKLKLKPFTLPEFHKFIGRLDREVNHHFPLVKFPESFEKSPKWNAVLKRTV